MAAFTKGLVALMALAPLAACEHGAFAPMGADADGPALVLTNAKVKTPDGWAEAMAVRGGAILAVGSADEVRAAVGASAERLDLEGRVVMPGFHDRHVHPLYGGWLQSGLTRGLCEIEQGLGLDAVRERVRTCMEPLDEGEWLTGGQWDASALGEIPDRESLDDVAPDNPVLLNDTSGHSAWANSRALAIAGVTADTPDPEGGIIERRADGEPTGVLRESAIDLVRSRIPQPTKDALRPPLEWALETMLSVGITAYSEASLGFVGGIENEALLYTELADDGVLKHRTRLCMTWWPGADATETVIAAREANSRGRLAFDCVKIFLDGVPTDSHTAAMLEPYADTVEGRDDEASRRGFLLVDQEVLNEAVARFDAMGLTVKFHAAGDAAVRAGLDAIAATREVNGMNGLRHNVGHCTFIHIDDIARGQALHATYELSPYLWSPSPINDDIIKAIGEERIERVWPFRDLVEAGSLTVAGSDWAVVPSVNPWIAVEALVTREVPGGSERSFGKDQAIALQDALDLFTTNAAEHMGMTDQIGALQEGALADFIVLDRNPYEIPQTELHQVQVLMTFIDGEKVYDADAS